MTGPEHYAEAVRVLETTTQEDPHRHHRMRVAQVHATLALTAATAYGIGAPEGMPVPPGWVKVIGPDG